MADFVNREEDLFLGMQLRIEMNCAFVSTRCDTSSIATNLRSHECASNHFVLHRRR